MDRDGRQCRLRELRNSLAVFSPAGRRWVWIFASVFAISDLGCAPAGQSYRAGIQSERPTDRIRAIYKAGELRDPLAVALLVDRLEDEDEGVRLYAFIALQKITGKRFGYDFAGPPEERARAVDRWRTYVREGLAAGSPTPDASDVGGKGHVGAP